MSRGAFIALGICFKLIDRSLSCYFIHFENIFIKIDASLFFFILSFLFHSVQALKRYWKLCSAGWTWKNGVQRTKLTIPQRVQVERATWRFNLDYSVIHFLLDLSARLYVMIAWKEKLSDKIYVSPCPHIPRFLLTLFVLSLLSCINPFSFHCFIHDYFFFFYTKNNVHQSV